MVPSTEGMLRCLEEALLPQPGPIEVRVRACGLGLSLVWNRNGRGSGDGGAGDKFPRIIGHEIADTALGVLGRKRL